MKYSELLSFNPIEDVIQLTTASDSNKAKEYVKNYVMSDNMAESLKYNVIEQLQYEKMVDNKGVLIVGNYGTGKSHLMSLISSVANNADYIDYIQNKKFAEYAKQIAGKFEVLRLEIGGITMPLRELLVGDIKEDFDNRGISFELPDFNKVRDNKKLIKSIIEAFATKYPEKGYLIVIDEFLSYLTSRDQLQIVNDLEFFRHIGEMASKSKLRIICGVQEKIFENPRFSFVSNTLMHVKDRFTQLIITKEATEYVVSERILKKTDEQKSRIRAHLEKFCPLYQNMSQKIDEFVDLFPIHPAYIDVFNKLYLIENRHILKNISLTIRDVFDDEVPEKEPGIFSFDSYWPKIKEDRISTTDPAVSKVAVVSSQLEDILKRNFPKKTYKPIAMQIMNALSVHRLTTNDLEIHSGLTAENLKEDLCLFIPEIPEFDSGFLLDVIRSTLSDILKTVSGQFIVCNELNNQYYLDINKTIDYDEEIRKKSELIHETDLNKPFYDTIYTCLEWDSKEYVPNYQIYQYDINWLSHNIFREGYLFLGHPNERSTAQPERDFYIIFMPPYGKESYHLSEQEDEIYLYFKSNDEFHTFLKYYYAAKELAFLSEGRDKSIYNTKAEDFRKKMYKFLLEKRNSCFEVKHNNKMQTISEILQTRPSSSNANFKDMLDNVASICFEELFEKKYPHFPKMLTKITFKNLPELISSVYGYFAGRKNNTAENILNSLNLISNNKIKPEKSPYAQYFINKLRVLPPKGVINYADIFEESNDKFPIDKYFKLDTRLLSVVFLAMIYSGQANLVTAKNKTITAAELDSLLTGYTEEEIRDFKYLSKPAKMAEAELKQLFDAIGLSPALLDNINNREQASEELCRKAKELCKKAVEFEHTMRNSFFLWGEPLLAESQYKQLAEACKNINEEFSNYSSKYNTPARLANFSLSSEKIEFIEKAINKITVIPEYIDFKNILQDITSYLNNIESLELSEELKLKLQNTKEKFRKYRDSVISEFNGREKANLILSELESLKRDYINFYISEHRKHRLNHDETVRKGKIQESDDFNNLKKLSKITFLNSNGLNVIISSLSSLKSCYNCDTNDLKNNPYCLKQDCRFKPNENDKPVVGALDSIESLINNLINDWTDKILKTLSTDETKQNTSYLKPEQKKILNKFLKDKKLPDTVDENFVNAINTVFNGFEPVYIDPTELIGKIEQIPALDETGFKKELNSIISKYTQDKDASKLRIVIKAQER